VLGAIFIHWNFYTKSYNGGNNKQLIALTFDDGPAEQTARILDILKAQDVQAAFFSIGKRVNDNIEIVKRWHAEDHVVGNHSFNHGFNFDWLPTSKMLAEINATNDVVEKTIGKTPKLFRPPYGVTNPNLARALSKSGMHSIGWNVRSFDTKAKKPEVLLDSILKKLKGGDIILLHDSMSITADILTDLIVKARQKGYTFARVDKLLDIAPYE
jgi:peptidoglycan/xylan/chitin deacetylase (PgdA/CDA1 family)